MGKKNQKVLGKSIIRQRAKSGGNIKHANSWLHCSELDTGTGPNVQSITEQTDLDDFLATAELAGTEFAAEKLNAKIVTSWHNEGLLSSETAAAIKQAQQEHQHFLRIPRRPEWDENMTTEELDQQEKESFLEWRRQLAQLQEKDHILLTPFERNLDFWRQLWRVIERSDVVVQIVDARNPLLFRCQDLESYVTEVDSNKSNLLLINKADFLTPEQRYSWARYFKSKELPVAFWSAQQENERLTALRAADEDETQLQEGKDKDLEEESDEEKSSDEENDVTLISRLSEIAIEEAAAGLLQEQQEIHDEKTSRLMESKSNPVIITSSEVTQRTVTSSSNSTKDCDSCFSKTSSGDLSHTQSDTTAITEQEASLCMGVNVVSKQCSEEQSDTDVVLEDFTQTASVDDDEYLGRLLTRDELLALFKRLHIRNGNKAPDNSQTFLTTVGLVGYPNVGKSSTINTLLNDKKVPVSATPGRTKHFQTLYVNDEVLLCDCPGLVFPSFVSTKADMILNGILPIDQMRDHVPPVSLLCQKIPRIVLEALYGIDLTPPQEEEESNRPPYADELLSAYGYMRGFMTSHGIPDESRSARYILKDYVKGKLLYSTAPPEEDETVFQQMGYKLQKLNDLEIKQLKGKDKSAKQMTDVDKDFFKQEQVRCFSRGVIPGQGPFGSGVSGQGVALPYKPWKKHHNRNKREKLRRLAKK